MGTTIAAIATPLAAGGISVLRISGDEAIAVAGRVFAPFRHASLEELGGYMAAYGRFLDREGPVDDGIALVYRAPESYTGEDVVELSCHGGVYVTQRVLRLLLEQGAVLAGPGEFTKRAFLNGKLSLTQAESVMDLIGSKNEQAMRSARAQMDGALFRRIAGIREELLALSGHLAAWVDYPEEEIEEVETGSLSASLRHCREKLCGLLDTFDTGKMLREGIETAIVGRTNAGKSTLMNLLSGCEKSIVTDIAGTTRDVVEETVRLGSAVLRLADTAGIRQTGDVVEQQGVSLAKRRIATAGLVLAVFDYSRTISEDDRQIVDLIRESGVPALAVINKTDLDQKIDESYIQDNFQQFVYTSAEDPDSLARLTEAIETLLRVKELDPSGGILVNERQRQCTLQAGQALEEALGALESGITLDAVTVLIEQALGALLELTGDRVTDQVVDQVFSQFCVGK